MLNQYDFICILEHILGIIFCCMVLANIIQLFIKDQTRMLCFYCNPRKQLIKSLCLNTTNLSAGVTHVPVLVCFQSVT